MATSFTYKSRKQYLNPSVEADDLKDVTGSYIGPNQILINILPDGSWDTSRVPADDEDLDISSVDDIEETAPEGGTWHILDKSDANDIILMDMMMNCQGHTNEWQITTVKEITLSDSSTYKMQYRNPVNDDTRHTFAFEKTTIDTDGTINFVRTEQWATTESIQLDAEVYMEQYRKLYDNAVSDAAKQKYKNLLEIYEIIDTDLSITHPRLNEIEFPNLVSLAQGSTFPE
tara:strand:+ start:290 stop:979 length:690 start_codon:yes stop_codon:yes gene_type:complete